MVVVEGGDGVLGGEGRMVSLVWGVERVSFEMVGSTAVRGLLSSSSASSSTYGDGGFENLACRGGCVSVWHDVEVVFPDVPESAAGLRSLRGVAIGRRGRRVLLSLSDAGAADCWFGFDAGSKTTFSKWPPGFRTPTQALPRPLDGDSCRDDCGRTSSPSDSSEKSIPYPFFSPFVSCPPAVPGVDVFAFSSGSSVPLVGDGEKVNCDRVGRSNFVCGGVGS